MREVSMPFLLPMRHALGIAFPVAGLLAILGARLFAEDIDARKLPPPAGVTVDFDRDVKPIFEKSCFRCHGPEKPKSRFRLDNQESALKGGEKNSNDIVPGNSAGSRLILYVARLVEDMDMPPAGKGDPLPPEHVALLRAWIDQGAKWSPESLVAMRESRFSITPTVRSISVSGNRNKFREDAWQKEGFTAGYERFEMTEPVGKDAELKIAGRALFPQEDYRVALTLARPDLGFVRAGYDTYRKYFNDTGGYDSTDNIAPPSLRRDLYVDIGKAWFDLGLTLPDWPQIVLGYEYQFKDGAKSTLQWGQVFANTNAFFGKPIYPAYKGVDEHAHIIKLELSDEIGGVALEDNFRAEFYDLRTERVNQGEYRPEVTFNYPDIFARHNESYNHFQAANTFRAEKQLRDWLFVSGGYLYTHLDADSGFNQAFSLLSSPSYLNVGDQTTRIDLQQESHTVNFNALLGPWDGLAGSAGVQTEWMRREGLSNLLTPGFTNAVPAFNSSSLDESSVEENVQLRYDRLPFTVLFAEGRFQQQWFDHFERGFVDDGFDSSQDFMRDTDATGDLRECRVGFTVSPVPNVSFETNYRRSRKRSDYDHLLDTDGSQLPFSIAGNGYPAFIRSREITSDEVEAKLVLRLLSWLKTTLKYQLVATDYNTVTDSATNTSANILYPGGEIRAGNQDGHVYSVNLTVTPRRRLYLSTTFSYSDSRIISGVNDDAIIAPYKGSVYSVLSSASFALNAATDFRFFYSFSHADYLQNNRVNELPLGIRYDRHGLNAGITRQITKNLTASVQYGFFRYREPSVARANDYTAHAVLASLNLNIP